MSTPPAERVAVDLPPTAETLFDICMNVLTRRIEGRFAFPDREWDETDRRVADAIVRGTLDSGIQPLGGIVRDRVLAGIQCLTEDLRCEVGVIAWTAEGDADSFAYLTSAGGSADSVALPVAVAGPVLEDRVLRRVPTRVLVTHNHPRRYDTDLLAQLLGDPVGPSGTDRRTSVAWIRDLVPRSQGAVRPEFMLLEAGTWRPITMPSASEVIGWIEKASKLLK